MRTLDRYVIRSFLLSAVLFFVVLMLLRIVGDLFVYMDEFAEGNRPLGEVLGHIVSYYSYQSLVYFIELGGLIIVAAAAFTLARMNHTNELTAIMASGVSLRRVVVPMIAAAFLLGGLIVLDREFVLPQVASKLARSEDQLTDFDADSFQVRLVPDGNRTVWWSPDFYPDRNEMTDVVAMVRDANDTMLCTITARRAYREGPEAQGWRLQDGQLARTELTQDRQGPKNRIYTAELSPDVLVKRRRAGERLRETDQQNDMVLTAESFRPPEGDRPGVLVHPRFTFHFPDGRPLMVFGAETATFHEQTEELVGYWEMDEPRALIYSDLTASDLVLRQSGRWLDYLSTRQLLSLLESDRVPNRTAVETSLHIRFAEPVVNLLKLLLVLPFILSRERNIKSSVGLGVLMLGIFFASVYLARYIGLTPIWSAWLPVVIFTPIALICVDSVKT